MDTSDPQTNTSQQDLITHALEQFENHYQNQDYPAAIEDIDLLLQIEPENITLWTAKGNLLNQIGDIQNAIEALREVTRIDPSHYQACLNLGILYLNQGNLIDAKVQLLKVLEYEPQNVQVLKTLAQIDAAKGEIEECLDIYESLIKEDRSVIEELSKLAVVYFYTEKEFETAKAMVKLILKYAPDHPSADLLKSVQISNPSLSTSRPSLNWLFF